MSRTLRFVLYRLDKVGGLERTAVTLISELSKTNEVEVLVLRGGVDPQVVQTLGSILAPKDSGPPPDVDIVVGLWAVAIWRLRAERHAPNTVIWEHSLVAERIQYDRRVRWLWKWARHLYRRSNAIVAVSEPTKRCLKEQLGISTQVQVIPNPILPGPQLDMEAFLLARTGSYIELIAVGRLERVKNHKMLLDALALLPACYRLTCLGDGSQRKPLERQISALGLAGRVRMLGHVERVNVYLQRADVLVQPSLSETFGLAAFEAAEWNVPVVCLSSSGALPEVIPKHVVGVQVSDRTPRGLANGIREGLGMRSNLAAFAAAREQRLHEFDLGRIASEWNQLFSAIDSADVRDRTRA